MSEREPAVLWSDYAQSLGRGPAVIRGLFERVG